MRWRHVFMLWLLMAIGNSSLATHLMGGELTYEYDGSIPGGSFYNVKLIVYRYCDTTQTPTAQLDATMLLGVFIDDTLNPGGPLLWYSTETIDLVGSDFVTAGPSSANCQFESTACIQRGEYRATLLLPDFAYGYHLEVERCCRNGNVLNLANPGGTGMAFYAFIPPGIVNSTPQITDVSVPYVCIGDTMTIINNAYDPDGDSLAYSFVIPYFGNGNGNSMPDPQLDINPYTMPIPTVSYAPGYSFPNFLGSGGYSYIDPITGLTKYYFQNQGFYVAAIEIKEFRNGIQISTIRRDIQFIAIVCSPNAVPNFTPSGNGTSFTIDEGQAICFDVTFTDHDGDSLFLTASGPLLNSSYINPPGTISNVAGDSIVTSQFCWAPTCGMSRPSPYQFSVTVVDNGCPPKATSEVFSVYVNPGPASLNPSVFITQTSPGILCQGAQSTLTAHPVLGGSSPLFIWQINGVNTGTSGSTLSTSSLNNGDVVTVTMISNATCVLTDTAFSAPFVVNISSQPAPVVTITSNPTDILCPQQICVFNATVLNGGAFPTYQWNINGNNAGINIPAFSAANPSGIISVYVTVTPSTGCPPQISNIINFNIPPWLNPNIALSATLTDSVCPGKPVLFTALADHTGQNPTYTWTLNGSVIGTNADTLSLPYVNENDLINVSVTSDYPCLSPPIAYADPLEYHIYPPLSMNLTDGPIQVCSGFPVDLDIDASGGNDSTYTYSWGFSNSINEEIVFIPNVSDYYFGTVNEVCYGQLTDSVFVEVLPVPDAEFTFTPATPSIFTPLVQFTDLSIDAVSWHWNLGEQDTVSEQNPAHLYLTTGEFPVELIVTNSVGCTDTAVKIIDIEDEFTAYIPNAFTPNGDGKNDYFGLIGFSTNGYTMSVFNRWGQEIFSSDKAGLLWNGNDEKGNRAPEGIYTYLIKVNKDKKKKPYTGTVALVR